jgi:glycine/D-amino acid oxidase-like deaminating enzyme
MNLRAGYPFWLIKDGLPFTYPKLANDIETDVVIVGAGISGALVRYYLVNAGIDCAMIDCRTIGLGSTCASTSLLQYEIDVPLSELIPICGKENAERAYQLCNAAVSTLGDICEKVHFDEFEFKNSLYFAAYKKDAAPLMKEYEARKAAGFDVYFLEKEQIEKEYGFSAPAAILSKHGAETNAYGLTHRLLQHHLGNIFDRTAIVKTMHHKTGVTLETEHGNTIKTKHIVYATGYEAVEMIDKKIVDLLSTYATISEQYATKQFWKDNVLIWNTADPYLYMRTTSDGRILIGGRDEEFYNPKKRDGLIAKKTKQLEKDFSKLFPEIEFKSEFSWAGTFGSTKDGLPYIGKYDRIPNSYFALGFGGNGITFSLVAAEIITDLILGKTNKDAEIFRFNR